MGVRDRVAFVMKVRAPEFLVLVLADLPRACAGGCDWQLSLAVSRHHRDKLE